MLTYSLSLFPHPQINATVLMRTANSRTDWRVVKSVSGNTMSFDGGYSITDTPGAYAVANYMRALRSVKGQILFIKDTYSLSRTNTVD